MRSRFGRKIAMGSLLLVVAMTSAASAGLLDSPAPPDNSLSAMYSLETIFERLNSGAEGAMRQGGFVGPSAAPGGFGHSLDDIMALAPYPDVKNGAGPGQVTTGKTYWGLLPSLDGLGILQWGTRTGTASVRFTDNLNGTVTDNRTGLVWLANANCNNGPMTWADALVFANSVQNGVCGLSDGSTAGEWRLPQIQELRSLINRGSAAPALPPLAPFTNVATGDYYWSSTTQKPNDGNSAWFVDFADGTSKGELKNTNTLYVWPVRDPAPGP